MVGIVTGSGLGLERSSAWVLGSRGQVGSAALGRDGEGVYVNAATGNLVVTRRDEILIGRGPDDAADLTYNSMGYADDDNGDNWRLSARLVFPPNEDINVEGSTITREDWDGSAATFTYDTSRGLYVSIAGGGAYDTIRYTGGQWHWIDGETQVDEYYAESNSYRLTTSTDTDGNTLTYSYDGIGPLTQVTTANGDYIKYVYSSGRLQRAETYAPGSSGSPTLTRVYYEYDGSGRLSTVKVNLNPNDNSKTTGDNYTTSYTYVDAYSTRLASIAQSDGTLLQFTYAEVDEGEFRISAFTQTVAAGVTRTTSFDYSVAGRTTITDPAGQKTILFYDADKNLTQITYPAIDANTAPRIVQFTYNASGDLLSATAGPGNVITYQYDGDGNCTLERDSAGNTIARTYSVPKNELLTETHYLVPDPDGAGSGTPSGPLVTHYVYDSHSHLRYVVSPEGDVTQYGYDGYGQQTSVVSFSGSIYTGGSGFTETALDGWAYGVTDKSAAQRTQTTYDTRGNVDTVTSYSRLLSTGLFDTSSDLSQTTYVYDQAGNLLSRVHNGSTASEVFTYDGLGRQTMATDFNGNVTRSFFYDSLGVTVLAHADGLSEISTYNRAGELISFSQSNAGGNLVDLTGWPGNPASPPSGHATVANWYNYSAYTDETQWATTAGPDGLPVVAIRSGQLDTSEEGGGNYTNSVPVDPTKAYEFTYYFKLSDLDKHYVYFGLGGNTAAAVEWLSTGADFTNPYFYYPAPNGTQAATFTADKWYKVVGYVLPHGSALSSTPLGGVYDVATGQKVADTSYTFRWNADTPPSSAYARFFNYYGDTSSGYSTYFYQPGIRQVSTPTVTGPDRSTSLYRYDNLGRLRMTVDPTGRRAYMMYDNVGRKVADIDADGSAIEYRYDGNDNLTSTTRYAARLSSCQLASLVDPNGNPTSGSFASLRPTANSSEDQWTFQVYDPAQRLIQTIDGTGATTVYTYDGASRVTSSSSYANRLSSTILASLRTEASNPNFWANPTNGALWSQGNLSVTAAGTIDGSNAYQFSTIAGGQWEGLHGAVVDVSAGDTVTYSISIKAVGSVTTDVVGIYGSTTLWDPAAARTTAQIVSGPGAIASNYGALWYLQNLSTTEATRVEITRTFTQAETNVAYLYVKTTSGTELTGDAVIVAAPVVTKTHTIAVNLPTADTTNDRVSRSFYDNDGRLIGMLDGEGYLTEIRYDKAGRKVQTIAYSGATSSTYRASGTFSQLVGSITADTAKDIHDHFVYDARGLLRATVDGEGVLTRYHYTPAGDVDEVRTGQQLDPVTLISTPPTLATLPSEPSGAIISVTSYTRDLYGRPANVAVTLTGSTTTTTHYVYDSMGRLISTTSQYGGSDPRTAVRRYDLHGRLAGELDAIGYASLPGSPTQSQIDAAYAAHGITYAYDAADRLISSTDAGGHRSLYYYDADGLLAYRIDPLGEVVEYRYDALGQRTDTIAYATRLGSLSGLAGGNVTSGLVSAVTAIASSTIDDATHLAFNVDGTVKQSTDQLGNVTTYTYNAFGEASAVVAPLDSRTIETDFAYDRRGLLKTQVVDPGTGSHLAVTTSYGYDAFGRALTLTNALTKVTTTSFDRDGRVKTITDALGNVTTNSWDSRGNLVAVTNALGKITHFVYDKADRRIATIDALGGVMTSSYDADGRVIATRAYVTAMSIGSLPLEVTESALSLPSTNANDQVTRFVYDKNGQLRFAIDGLMHVVENGYDAVGNVVSVTAYDGTISPSTYSESEITGLVASLAGAAGTRVTRSVYDAADRLSFAIDALNQVTLFGYDTEGRLIKQTGFIATYSGSGNPSLATMNTWVGSNTGGNDRVTRAYYDRKGQLDFSIDALGYVTRVDYDKQGNVTKQTRYADAYSASDSTTLANLVSAFASPPSTRRETSFAYDNAGRLVQTTDPEGFVTKLTLDAMGRILSSAESYGLSAESATSFTYDDAGRTTSITRGYGAAEASTSWFFYDGIGRQRARVDGDKYLTIWAYDDGGNLTSETRYAGAITGSFTVASSVATLQSLAGSVDVTTSTTYDALYRVATATDARGSVTSRTYDALGEVLTQTGQMESGSGDDRITHWTYDSFGDAVTMTDARGNQTISFYDKLGRVVRVSDPYQYFTDTTYSRGGMVASIKQWAIAKSGTVTASTYPGNPTADSAHDAVTSFTYDKNDRLTAVTDAEGYVESYTLNAFGERTQVRNKLYVSGSFDTTVSYTFDKNGLVLTETLPVTTKTSGGSTISVENHYSYDAHGNRTQAIEAYGAAEVRTTNYAYDKLDRLVTTTHDTVSIVNDDLTTATGITPTETLKYDKNGNVIEQIDAGGARTLLWYDDLGRAVAQVAQSDKISGVDKGTLTRTTYDGNGNALTVKVYGDLISLPSDATGSIPSPGDADKYRLTSFAYDRSNRLITTTTVSLLTGEFASGSYAFTTGSAVSTNEYDMAGNVIHAEDGRGNDVYTWYDKLNRKIAQVDAENYLTTWSYDAEGNATSETRFATKLSSFTAPSASAVTTPPSASTSADDRTTSFGYDRNGRRTSEVRSGVAYAWINASTGAATDTSGSSTITYTYNGLGQVASKTQVLDAHSTPVTDAVTYSYDQIGRLILETDPSFTDSAGATVAPRTAFSYDGLGNLRAQRLQAAATANDTDDRITTYTYGAGGRMATMTDAAGFAHSYGYDKAGRIVRDSYTRTLSDNSTTVTEAQITRYDLAGRATIQTLARLSGSTWLFTDADSHAYDAVRIRYNAYGDVNGRGLTAGPGATAVYQETFDYDAGGRLWRSNAGDGVLRFYVYDKAGNQTLTLASTGADLSAAGLNLTLANYTASINTSGVTSGDTNITGAVTTINVFDKRGMQIQTREPDRQLTSSTTALIVQGKSYNAFGEVASETDPRGFDTSGNPISFSGGAGYTTTFAYNTMGRLITKVSPQVSVTAESGAVTNTNPTEHYGYDLSGRLVSVTDANSHTTTRTLLAGTGRDGGEALVTAEYHPDGGVARTFYDVFGDARLIRNELSTSATASYNSTTDEQLTYDKMSRLETDAHRGTVGTLLTDNYVYDGLGQRTRHTNSFFGTGNVERTDYDAKGRVVGQVSFGGDATTTAYAWDTTINDGSFGDFDGWAKTVTYANGKQLVEKTDMFGDLVAKTDLGGHASTYAYDMGGRMVGQSVTGETLAYAYFNTGRVASVSSGTSDSTLYGYDKAGNEISEWTQRGGVVVQNATADFDALGRMTHWAEAGNTTGTITTAAADLTLEYDSVGNVRHRLASYHKINDDRSIASATSYEDYWYAYDWMNRFTVTKGVLTGTAGATGTTVWQGTAGDGVLVEYDKAGQRVGATRTTRIDIDVGVDHPVIIHRNLNTHEIYTYDAAGYLKQTWIAQEHWDASDPHAGAGGIVSPDPVQQADYQRDMLGRVTLYREYDPQAALRFSRATTYNDRSDITAETQIRVVADGTGGTDVYQDVTNNYYNAVETFSGSGIWVGVTSGGTYMGGTVTRSVTESGEDKVDGNGYLDSLVPDTETINSLTWWDGAQQSSISHDKDTGTSNTLWTSSFSYDALGHIVSVAINDGRDRTVSFVTDANGLVFQRSEQDNDSSHGDPREINYYFRGVRVGDTSNNGTSDTDYVTSMLDHWSVPQFQGAFRNGNIGGTNYADFNQSYDPLNGNNYAGAASHYTAQQGDTLQSVALAVWGDSAMWYLIAEANGLSGGSSLVAGTSLVIPNKVTNVHNNGSTFKVYDPNKAFGDLSPTDAKPGKHGGCGMVGQILSVVVAVAASYYFGPILGNVVSQGFNNLIGVQHGFSWKSLAISTITAALTPPGTGNLIADVALNVAANVATQGIAVATGLQKKFDWTGVAVAGVTAGISRLASKVLPGHATYDKVGGIKTPATLGNGIASSAAGAIAGAATRSVITGTDFGDNLIAVLPTVIGQTVGNLIGNRGYGEIRGSRDGAVGSLQDVPISVLQKLPDLAPNSASLDSLLMAPDQLAAAIGGAYPPPQAITATSVAAPSGLETASSHSPDEPNVLPDIVVTARGGRFGSYRAGHWRVMQSDGPDAYHMYELIHQAVRDRDGPALVTAFINRPPGLDENHGGPRSFSIVAHNELVRFGRNVGDSIDDIRDIASRTPSRRGRALINAAADELTARDQEYNSEHPIEAYVMSGINGVGFVVNLPFATEHTVPTYQGLSGETIYASPADRERDQPHAILTPFTLALGLVPVAAPLRLEAEGGVVLSELATLRAESRPITTIIEPGAGSETQFLSRITPMEVGPADLSARGPATDILQGFEPTPGTIRAFAAEGSLSSHLGRAGETASAGLTGLPKNTLRIPSASGARQYRIPDHLEPLDQRYVVETKNVRYQSLTSQILDDVAHVNRSGYPGRVDVIIDERTIISGPLLREHLNPGSPIKIITTNLNRR